jgi:hypothetical protein
MTVHIDELHTSVAPTAATSPETALPVPDPLGRAVDQWREARLQAESLRLRLCAEGFDD